MSTNNDELLYDEDDSVKFIQNYLPQELKGKFSNDDINYIVDLIYDFYESNGMLDDDGDDEIEIDERPERRRRQIRTGGNHFYSTRRT